MEYQIHTDLAIESSALLNKDSVNDELNGVESTTRQIKNISLTEITITDAKGEKLLGKPKGKYVSLEVPDIRVNISKAYDNTREVLAGELKKFIKSKNNITVLVVGLGNRFVTPDALGPKVIDKLLVTRHLHGVLPKDITKNMNSLCAIAPGVLGITGIESAEIIKGVTDKIKPDYIIAIDALASRKTSRISTTFQIANTGITPGSGIGNKRQALNKETLGVPVIAIGVPTVIEAVAVANDAIDMMVEAIKSGTDKDSPVYKSMDIFDNEYRYKLISEILSPSGEELIVTPKEVDSMIDEISGIIADSINEAINGDTARKLGEIV